MDPVETAPTNTRGEGETTPTNTLGEGETTPTNTSGEGETTPTTTFGESGEPTPTGPPTAGGPTASSKKRPSPETNLHDNVQARKKLKKVPDYHKALSNFRVKGRVEFMDENRTFTGRGYDCIYECFGGKQNLLDVVLSYMFQRIYRVQREDFRLMIKVFDAQQQNDDNTPGPSKPEIWAAGSRTKKRSPEFRRTQAIEDMDIMSTIALRCSVPAQCTPATINKLVRETWFEEFRDKTIRIPRPQLKPEDPIEFYAETDKLVREEIGRSDPWHVLAGCRVEVDDSTERAALRARENRRLLAKPEPKPQRGGGLGAVVATGACAVM